MESKEYRADPQQLRAEAQKEQRRLGLDVYADTIRLLKDEKDFSLREIAAWLKERGVEVDHNAVWRTYSKSIRQQPSTVLSEQNKRIERKGPQNEAMPWM